MTRHVARSAIWHSLAQSLNIPSSSSSTRFLPSLLRPASYSATVFKNASTYSPFRSYITTSPARNSPITIAATLHGSSSHSRIARLTAPTWTSPILTSRTKRYKSHDTQSHSPDTNPATSKTPEHPIASSLPSQDVSRQPSESVTEGKHHSLLDRLPQLHRPTKEELLAATSGFWQRLGVRFKWFSIRSVRPFNTDDISAFVSWFLAAHLLWFILGTTTFVSLAVLAINSIFAQETLAGWIGNYLTKSTGVKIVFESAVVPKWKDGVITFRNVFVSRRPGQGQATVSKGSSISAAAAAAAANKGDKAPSLQYEQQQRQQQEEDANYTQFDVTINTVNVTLSFAKWFNGKGLLRDVEIKGVRGVIDRTHVLPGDPDIDPRSYRREHSPGDFEIDSFKVEDVLLTVHQPNQFRPFSVSLYSCDLPRLRKQWLFYDLMSANMISGSFDDSLFTIHPRQTHNQTGLSVDEANGDPSQWKKHSRLRIDALNIDHLNRGVEGPFSWIHEGNVDIVADIMFPADADGSIAKVMSDFYDRMEATVKQGYLHTTHQHDMSDHHAEHYADNQDQNGDDSRFVVMDLRVHLNDVRAGVPIFTKDLSYVNNALIRPIVAYINSKRAFIPVNCRVVKRVSEFDGSWTIFDSGLLDDMSKEVRMHLFRIGLTAAVADIWIDV